MKVLLSLLCSTLLSGCIVMPKTVSAYDAKCDLVYDRKTLTVETVQLGSPGGGMSCDQNCAPLLIALAAIPPASAVVSGSIVLVGNTISWIERQRQCLVSSALGAWRL